MNPPLNIAQFERRLADVAEEFHITVARARLMFVSAIVSQMIPEQTVVKGGMGIKLRLGDLGTRAHDLVDLQILMQENVDIKRIRILCERVFSWRNAQDWPPLFSRDITGWEKAYQAAVEETGTAESFVEFSKINDWFSGLIQQIEAS